MYVSLCAPYSVILNGVKNLEASVAVDGSTSLEILRYTQDDIDRHDDTIYSVILNGVKNLEASVAVDGSTSLEILRYTQDDITRRCFDFAQHDIVSEPTYPHP